MKKGLFATILAVLLAFAAVTPAYATNSDKGGNINAVEDRLLARFDSILKKDWVTKETRGQYYGEARNALLDSTIDLNSTAEEQFNGALDKIETILDGCSSQAEAYKHVDEITGIVNGVSKSYNMTVTVSTAKGHAATVTIAKDGGSTVVATTAKAVKQTGFGLAQTALVVAASAVALTGAFFVARKNNLFA